MQAPCQLHAKTKNTQNSTLSTLKITFPLNMIDTGRHI